MDPSYYQDGNQPTMPFPNFFGEDNAQQLFGLGENILDPHDQGYMNNFFTNPDGTLPLTFGDAGAPFSMDTKPEQSEDSGEAHFSLHPASNTVNPATTYSGAPSSMYQTHLHANGNANATAAYAPSNPQQAAESLAGMGRTPASQQSAANVSTQGSEPGAVSWGSLNSFAQSSSYPGVNMQAPNSYSPFANSHDYSHGQLVRQPFALDGHDYISNLSRMPHQTRPHSRSYAHPATQTRHLSIDVSAAIPGHGHSRSRPRGNPQDPERSPATAYPAPERPQLDTRFGSDPNFSNGAYNPGERRVPGPDKSRNLVMAYVLPPDVTGQRSANGHMSTPEMTTGYRTKSEVMNQPAGDSSPSGRNGQPFATPSSAKKPKGAKWDIPGYPADASNANGSATNGRKRRRSNARDDDGDWSPDQATTRPKSKSVAKIEPESDDEGTAPPNKRRRASTFQPDNSASPAADDDNDAADEPNSKKKSRSSKKTRENLSDAQKRANHIASEKKRRDIINQGYANLNTMVPILVQSKSSISRSESLVETAAYLESLQTGLKQLMHRMPGVGNDEELKRLLNMRPGDGLGARAKPAEPSRPMGAAVAGAQGYAHGSYD